MKEFVSKFTTEMLPIAIGLLLICVVIAVIIILYRKAQNKVNKEVASIKTNGGVCPKCGGELIMRDGKYGKFIGCTNYPKCKYTQKS